jgi:hypothetical protein
MVKAVTDILLNFGKGIVMTYGMVLSLSFHGEIKENHSQDQPKVNYNSRHCSESYHHCIQRLRHM